MVKDKQLHIKISEAEVAAFKNACGALKMSAAIREFMADYVERTKRRNS